MGHPNPLPRRFPDGTRYVVEGRNGSIQLRYLEFPDGRHIDLPADLAPPKAERAARRRLRKRKPA
jgi:hypothetical protein